MQRWQTILGTAAVLVAGMAMAPAAHAQDASKIGYVNVKTVLDKYQRTDYEQQRLREKRAVFQKKLEDLVRQKDELETKIELLPPGSAKYEDTKRQILKLEQDIKFEREWSNYRIGSEYAKATIKVYQDLLRQVEAYAKANGYTLVLKIEGDEIESDSLVEVNVRINGRAVLFYDAKHDITDAVVKALNTEWEKSGHKPPPDPKDGGDDKKDGDAKGDGGNGGTGSEKPK